MPVTGSPFAGSNNPFNVKVDDNPSPDCDKDTVHNLKNDGTGDKLGLGGEILPQNVEICNELAGNGAEPAADCGLPLESANTKAQNALKGQDLYKVPGSTPITGGVSAPKDAVTAAAEIGLLGSTDMAAGFYQEPAVRQEMVLFAGPNNAPYVCAWERLQTLDFSRNWSWSASGFVFSIAWFAYRRLYVIAMVWLIALAAAALYKPVLGAAILASAMICGGFFGKSIYAHHADQVIRSKIKSASEPDQYIASLVRAGGVSLPMGIFVGFLAIGLISAQGFL